MIFLNKQLKS